MKSNQIKVGATAPVTDTVSIEVKPEIRSSVQFAAPAERVPSNWKITPVEGGNDMINAVNTQTGLTFSGTVAEFNKLLKG